jgi:hypothetical protein
MSVIQVESELKKMTNTERLFVIEIATKLIGKDMNEKHRLSLEEKRAKLRQSADMMVSEYKTNKDLTALTSLDGEDFLDA